MVKIISGIAHLMVQYENNVSKFEVIDSNDMIQQINTCYCSPDSILNTAVIESLLMVVGWLFRF